MTRSSLVALTCAVLLMPGAGGCTATGPLRLEAGRTPPVSRLSDLKLASGAEAVVLLIGGDTVRGIVKDLRPAELELLVRSASGDLTLLTIPEADIQTLAKVVRLSKGARTRLGAVIGAAATLPFSISMFGDMVVPGAIVGALIGRGTGDSHAEILFERTGQSL